jgi:2',3'-cyclic-nucleotide 2'-phosphodiesterase (5'-nucleotidase family)
MLGRVRGVPIVSSDQHGVGLARIRFCRPAPGAAPALERLERRVAMASRPPASELGRAVAAAVLPWQEKVKALADAVVATLPRPCLASTANGTALAEQTARAIAEQAKDAAAPPRGVPVVGLVNTGGLRSPLPAGTLRYRDLFATSPFENGVAICGTTRAGLTRLLANAVAAPGAREQLPFGIAGARVTLERRPDSTLAVSRVVVDGAAAKGAPPARDDDPVWLAVPDFILAGGDGLLDGVTCATSTTTQVRVRDAWRAVIAREQSCDGLPKNVFIAPAGSITPGR